MKVFLNTKFITIFAIVAVVGALSVSALAAGEPTIDTSAIVSAFSSSIGATLEIILGIIPLAGGLLALSLGVKKGLQFIKRF